MSRSSKYVDAALQVLDELGGGPIPSKTLVAAIIEKGLLEDRKYLYNNILNKVRESDLFDTTKRGFVSLTPFVENDDFDAQAATKSFEDQVSAAVQKPEPSEAEVAEEKEVLGSVSVSQSGGSF